MKRTFNYTGRQKIPQERITIKLNRRNNIIESFTATIDLEGMNLPTKANVYIEAYHGTDYARYHFGTVGNLTQPKDTKLENLAYTENLLFRVLVVDTFDRYGRIIAAADRISPSGAARKKTILPVDFQDIGQRVWQLRYDDDAPLLIFNKNIPNIENLAKTDVRFFFFVYPFVLREILMKMVYIDGIDNISDPERDWHADWLKYINKFSSNQTIPKVLDPRNENFDKDEVEIWINKVIDEFCSYYLPKWHSFINQLQGGSG